MYQCIMRPSCQRERRIFFFNSQSKYYSYGLRYHVSVLWSGVYIQSLLASTVFRKENTTVCYILYEAQKTTSFQSKPKSGAYALLF